MDFSRREQDVLQPTYFDDFSDPLRGFADRKRALNAVQALIEPDQHANAGRAQEYNFRQVQQHLMRPCTNLFIERAGQVVGPIAIDTSTDRDLDTIARTALRDVHPRSLLD